MSRKRTFKENLMTFPFQKLINIAQLGANYSCYSKKLREKYNQLFSSIHDHTLKPYAQPVALLGRCFHKSLPSGQDMAKTGENRLIQ